jgi:hypothetical protein
MAHSLQDLETEVEVLKRKIDFLLSFLVVSKREPNRFDPRGYTETQLNGHDLYKEISNQGGLTNGTDADR